MGIQLSTNLSDLRLLRKNALNEVPPLKESDRLVQHCVAVSAVAERMFCSCHLSVVVIVLCVL